ncbi:hypothetical protein O181_129945 [Austropuccinia psidii MF-1]|uniref:Uncharacterized protein n=1 Tax=Austropuccinia psidii MF-1 TaxID=1389203 RepID=A0A9Q3L2W0_9BASI|nr:hypothetical protein [Austropuccinia psidii MF-1]
MLSTRSGASYKPSSSSQKGHRCDYGRSQSDTEGQGAETTTKSLSGHLQSQPEGVQQCTHQGKSRVNCWRLTSHQANIKQDNCQETLKHTSHSGLTPNPVTSANIGSPVPSTEIPHHRILPQPSKGW